MRSAKSSTPVDDGLRIIARIFGCHGSTRAAYKIAAVFTTCTNRIGDTETIIGILKGALALHEER